MSSRVNILSPRVNIFDPRVNILSPRDNIFDSRVTIFVPRASKIGSLGSRSAPLPSMKDFSCFYSLQMDIKITY